jgi:two-component system sensor histidine kinase BaeS
MRQPGTLATRVAYATTGCAAAAVLLAGLVSVGLVRDATDEQARRTLARQADLVVEVFDEGVGQGPRPRPRNQQQPLVRSLQLQGVEISRVTEDGLAVDGVFAGVSVLDTGDLARLVSGCTAGTTRVSDTRQIAGIRNIVEARCDRALGIVVLMQPVDETRAIATPVLRRLVLALLAGLVVAAGVGVLVARRLARPLQVAAGAAHRLAAGGRGERVDPSGPAEVAAVAEGLNELSGALERSEGRQREFLLSVSHELRTPLTAIRGFAEAVADGVTTGADVPEAASVIVAEADRLERLVRDLLDLARLGADDFAVHLVDVDLTELLGEAATVWRGRCEAEGVHLRVELPEALLPVVTDPGRLRQVVDGLAENALRVTPAGETIVLAVLATPTGAVVEVRDSGPGLTPDDCAVAFERSALYDRYRGVRRVGTGFGLAIVAGLVERLGGTVEAGTAAEGGARFSVTLPARPTA